MASEFHSSLKYDLRSMLNNADDRNVVIHVGENQNTKEFRAHSSILKGRSAYFKNEFSSKRINIKDDTFEFDIPNVNPNIF